MQCVSRVSLSAVSPMNFGAQSGSGMVLATDVSWNLPAVGARRLTLAKQCQPPFLSARSGDLLAFLIAVFAMLFTAELGCAQSTEDATTEDTVTAQARPGVEKNEGRITEVTLYRDRALVTREIAIAAGAALRTLQIPDLPYLTAKDTIHAAGDGMVDVRSLHARHGVSGAGQQEIADLEVQLTQLENEQAEAKHAVELATAHLKSLDNLTAFTFSAASQDLNRGVLDADTLTELTKFSMVERTNVSGELFQHQKTVGELATRIGNMQQRRAELQSGESANRCEVMISVGLPENQAGTLRLSYQVTGCGWSPEYTVYGESGKQTVLLGYNAQVHQASGEDWNEVRLTLSTASPNINSASPQLTPLRIASVATDSSDPFGKASDDASNPFSDSTGYHLGQSVAEVLRVLDADKHRAAMTLRGGDHANGSRRRDLALNGLAIKVQQVELQAAADSLRTLAPDVHEDVASQVYTLERAIRLDNRPGNQQVQIVQAELSGEMVHVATPLLSTYAFREARVTNDLGVGLLAGPASVYLDDRFVGNMHIPSTAAGQHLTIGFGADQQVRTRRELLEKQDDVQGGNRQLKFNYRLVVSNFKDEAVDVRLLDRLPVTRETRQMSIHIDQPQQELSQDALYQRAERPLGILRWDLAVPKGRNQSNAFDVHYSFSMAFDRNRLPTAEGILAEMEADFDSIYIPGTEDGGMGGGMGGMGGGGFFRVDSDREASR